MTARRSHSSGRARPFSNIDFLYSLRPSSMKLGLENITGLLAAMGDPQSAFPAVLVAGTNGKGSVTSYLSSILSETGLKTGTFYSPHLFRINERVRIDGREITSRALDDAVGKLRVHHDRYPFTFFEGMTAAAALHFMREKVDIAVFEVGLGGRLDATRLVDAAVTVVTGISRDHTQHLGRSTARILAEKLGIARKGVPVVANLRSPALRSRAGAICLEKGAPLVDARDWRYRRLLSVTSRGTEFRLETRERDYGRLVTIMPGRVQMENATTAVRCVETLARAGRAPKADYSAHVAAGLKKTFLPGRFQVIGESPALVMDVSHNEESLAAALDTLARAAGRGRKRMLLGLMSRKELGGFPAKAVKALEEIIIVPLAAEGAATAGELAERFAGLEGEAVITVAGDVRSGVERATEGLGEGDMLLVTGSHHTVEEAGRHL